MNLKELRNKLEQCWDKKTSFSRTEGSRGQCYVTALLISKLYDCEIMHGHVLFNGIKEHHFWNSIHNLEIDLTSDQYGGDGINPITTGKWYGRANFKNRRFLILEKRFECLQ